MCLVIAIPAWILGNIFPVIGGAVIAILAGMIITVFLKQKNAVTAGIKFTSKKSPSMGSYIVRIRTESQRYCGDRASIPAHYPLYDCHIIDCRFHRAQSDAHSIKNININRCRIFHLRRICRCCNSSSYQCG